MTDTPLAAVLRHIRQMVPPPTEGNISDAVLLCRFTRQRDPDAFALLVRRYGPLVWRVCRRVLAQADAAEDAFQATFLVFARRAGSLRKPESLAAFRHGIAYHVARRARAEVRRRPPSSRLAESRTGVDPSREAAWRELGQIIEEEVHRLPETLRAPLLLCYWQGQTNEEAARSLGWPCGTVKTRLAKARRLLHERLSRRGVTLPAGGAALLLAPGGSDAAMPRRLLTMAADRPAGVPAGARALA